MKHVRAITLAALLGLTAFAAAAEPRMSDNMSFEYTNERPLMVIRFNQRNVHFERQLYGTLEQVVRIKPTVMFDLVAMAPEGGPNNDSDTLREAAASNGQRVFASMMRMGVPKSRIHYVQVADPSIRYSEVRIFAR